MTHGAEWLVALVRIAGMFLVMLVGFVARRRRLLGPEILTALGRLLVDVCLPALILGQMLTTVDGPALRAGASMLGGALVVALLGWAVGWATQGLCAQPGSRPTYVLCVATPNWVYLPLPIASALYGEPGTLAVLLYNVVALVLLWILGPRTLRGGGGGGRRELGELLRNPGLIATVGGVALALAFPGLRGLARGGEGAGGLALPLVAALQAVELVGSITVPLSLIVIGAQLAAEPLQGGRRGDRTLAFVIVARLLVAPACVLLGLVAAAHLGVVLPEASRRTLCLIAGMPVAVNCGMFAERFGGDSKLASRAIFMTTVASVASVPALLALGRTVGL